MKTYNWRPFLERWSADWTGSPAVLGREGGAGALGFAPAGEERVAALEARLGMALPPTYRSFLATTDGWRAAGTGIRLLGTADGVRRCGDGGDRWSRALLLSAGSDTSDASGVSDASDGTEVLLDPDEVSADGEWAAYLRRPGRGQGPGRGPGQGPGQGQGPGSGAGAGAGAVVERYESFMDLMQALFREFHRANRATPGFSNETTRELDADIEEARTACLAGADAEEPLALLTVAAECGRARAHGPRAQVEALLSGGDVAGSPGAGGMDDPLYARELLPLYAHGHLRAGLDAESFLTSYEEAAGDGASSYDGADQKGVREVLRAVDERTFRYEAPGPFGDAVAAAREQARWGGTEAAWRTLEAALTSWEPYGDDHLAPVGLLADPLLGPLITPERGRLVLETPRGAGREDGGPEEAQAPEESEAGKYEAGKYEAGKYEADGLAWLTDEERRSSYRFVLVRDLSPLELAGRIGSGPLSAPSDEAEAGAAARVGRCAVDGDGESWSFAFESAPEPFREDRPSGPGAPASRGTASVTVWCERGSGTFHFSYREDGRRVYGFTVRGGAIERWGALPEPLDPVPLFPGASAEEGDDEVNVALDPDDEYEALAALSEVYGVSLPRFAIGAGRLHAVVTGEPGGARQAPGGAS